MSKRALVVAVAAMVLAGVAAGSASSAAKTTTLRLSWQSGGWSVAIDALIKNFERQYPNINVQVEYAPIATYAQYVTTEFQAGNAPDLVFGGPGTGINSGLGILWNAGRLVDLSKEKWAKRVGRDTLLWSGKHLYGLPVGAFPLGVIYNKALVQQLNLTIPQTFSALVADCRKAVDEGTVAFSLGGATPGIFNMAVAGTYVMGLDPNWNEKRAAGKVTFSSSPLWHTALQRILDMKAAGCWPPQVASLGIPQSIGLFASGHAAFYVAPGDGTAAIHASAPQLDLGMYPFPGDTAAQTRVVLAYSQAIGINKASSHIAEAKEFLAFAAREGQSKVLAHFMGIPTVTEAKRGVFPSYMSGLVPAVKKGKVATQAYLTWPNPNVYSVALTQGVTGLLTGQLSIDDVLHNMDAAWNGG